MYQRILTTEHRNKISQALKGRKHTEEHCKAISKGVKAAWDRVPKETNQSRPNNHEGKEV